MNSATARGTATDIGAPMPNNLDAERSVLGAVLLDNKALEQAKVRPEDFFLDQHRRVFVQMLALAEGQQPIDLVTLTEALHRGGALEASGGAPYLATLMDGLPKVSNVAHYAKIVRENAKRRELVYEADRIQHAALESEGPPEGVADQGVRTFRELAIRDVEPGTPEERLSNLLDDARTRIGTCEVPLIVSALQSELRQIAQPQDFPAPLAKIALQGIVGQFVEAALPCTEADESCLVYQFLTAMGNVMGRNNHGIFGSDVHFPNLFTLIVGDTSAGKGQGLSAVRHLMSLVDQNWEESHCKYSAASGEAVVRLASQTGDDGRLCLIMPEMSVLLNSANREGSNTSGYLRLGWDGLPMENNRSRSADEARNYLLSLVGHITPEELTEIFSNVDWYNGMANRFLWATVRKSKTLSRMERKPNFVGITKTIHDLLALPSIGQVRFTEEGGRFFDDWVQSLPTFDGKLGASQQRIRPNALRVAQIYAALNERRLVMGVNGHYAIEPEHVAAAIEIVTRSRESIQWFLDRPLKIDAKAGQEDIIKFRAAMNANGGRLSGRQLAALFSHKNAEQRNEIASRAGGKIRSLVGAKGGNKSEDWTW
jgi:DnaB-like helicase N terminal domain/Protein of unknown function (DUF3987)